MLLERKTTTGVPNNFRRRLWGPAQGRDDGGVYLPAFHALVSSAISAFSASLIADGVREKRGAGAGWVTPWRSTKMFRAALCGCFGASAMVRIGAKQTSVPSMILHQSSRVLLLNTFVNFSFNAGQALRSIWASKSASVRPACWRSRA